jgi:small GTP-binding protein
VSGTAFRNGQPPRLIDFSPIGFDTQEFAVQLEMQLIRINLWDTSGQEQFFAMMPPYLHLAHMIIFVYDITNRQNFEAVEELMRLSDYPVSDACRMLVGTRSDLSNWRNVSTDEGEAFANENGMPFIEVSALTGANVTEGMTMLVEEMMRKADSGG